MNDRSSKAPQAAVVTSRRRMRTIRARRDPDDADVKSMKYPVDVDIAEDADVMARRHDEER
jgi:hypothetical protein